MIRRIPIRLRTALLLAALLGAVPVALTQEQHPPVTPPPPTAKKIKCSGRHIPQLEDITEKAGIRFRHTSNPLNTYIVESMSGGVILFDYDRDGWLDIYFTNAPTVEMALRKETSRGALYHNNRDGSFTDVTDKSGLATPCFAMGGAVADYNNDGWPVDKREGSVKDKLVLCSAGAPLALPEKVEDQGSGNLTQSPAGGRSFHQPSIRPVHRP